MINHSVSFIGPACKWVNGWMGNICAFFRSRERFFRFHTADRGDQINSNRRNPELNYLIRFLEICFD